MSGIETRYRNSSGLQGRLIHSCVLAEFLREMKLYLAMMGGMALRAGFLARHVNFAGDTYFWEYNRISLWHYRGSASLSQFQEGYWFVCQIFFLWDGSDATKQPVVTISFNLGRFWLCLGATGERAPARSATPCPQADANAPFIPRNLTAMSIFDFTFTDSSGTTGDLALTMSGEHITAISGNYDGSAVTGFDGQLAGGWMPQYPFYASTSAMEVAFNLANGNSEIIFEDHGIKSVITDTHDGSYTQECNYTITSDNDNPLCFCAGTRIATPAGEVRVETLRAGDLVLTATGEAKPVRWLGRSDVSATFADSLRSAPIRIAAGALAENLPMRDLRVSPAHAVFLNGILVQAAALVNGVTIVRERLIQDFSYYHVELESHELLISEGLATESFVDNIDRMAFSNWDERTTPVTPIAEMPYPRAKSARQLPRALREVLTQGLAMTA